MAEAILWGVVTWYSLAQHAGQPLRCGGEYVPVGEWIAVDIDRTGWQCGDHVVIWSGGVRRDLTVCDSGPLAAYCVRQGGQCLPIVADVPEHVRWFPGLSTRAVIVNASRARAEFARQAGC